MLFLRDVLKIDAKAIERAYDMGDDLIVSLHVPSYERERDDRIAKELTTTSEMPWKENPTDYIIENLFDAAKEVITDYFPNAEFKTVVDGTNSELGVVSRTNLARREVA